MVLVLWVFFVFVSNFWKSWSRSEFIFYFILSFFEASWKTQQRQDKIIKNHHYLTLRVVVQYKIRKGIIIVIHGQVHVIKTNGLTFMDNAGFIICFISCIIAYFRDYIVKYSWFISSFRFDLRGCKIYFSE